ncbi:hypothetical protein [Acinetobacter junii]|uniref:hypothetical protein n=1 Tax=Acinetobacter junii TaxID=40215 RepID=UPI003A860860
MEFITAEIIDTNGARTGTFKNIYVERDILAETNDNDVYKIEETNEVVNLVRRNGQADKEFELIKDGYKMRLKTLGYD